MKFSWLLFFSFFLVLSTTKVVCQKVLTENQTNTLRQTEDKERKAVSSAVKLFYDENDKDASYTLSHKLLKTLKTDASKSRLTHLISCYFLEQTRASDSALHYSKKALEFTTFSHDSIRRKRHILASISMANSFLSKGLFKQAKKITIEGLEKAESWHLHEERDRFTLFLGDLYSYDKEFDRSIQLLEKITESNDIDVAVGAMMSLGRIYRTLEDYKKSNEYNNKALKINKNPYYDLAVRLSMVKNLKYTGKKNEIIPQLKGIVKRGDQMRISHLKNQAKKELINAYLEGNQPDKAKDILLRLLDERKEEGNLIEILFCYDRLKRAALQKGSFEQALQYSEDYFSINDSINQLQKSREINEIEIKFETLQKEKENDQLKKDKERQIYINNLILAISSMLIILILLFALGYYQKLKTQKELNKTQKLVTTEKINSLMKEQELKLIKATIEGQDKERTRIAQGLHDSIGNDLAAIKLLIGGINTLEIEKIQNLIDITYQKVREISHNTIPKKNRKNEYVEILKEYINNINEATELKIKFVSSDEAVLNEIDTVIQNELFIILQELITNTLKHAEAKQIEIRLECVLGKLHLTFDDDGKGFSVDLLDGNKGIGIHNIKNRVKKLSGSLHIDSHPKRGTLFKIEMDKDFGVIPSF